VVERLCKLEITVSRGCTDIMPDREAEILNIPWPEDDAIDFAPLAVRGSGDFALQVLCYIGETRSGW
jgi:hypothetical protein